ncbi:hypothetical protein VD0004_g6298 [Verticillium dahliae]|nr:hypothetical protein VD0004_g6298 [Verticillium dahliae]PNH72366.1 hypothetical protein VD0001_g5168 [Verticillium dahliae]RBQ87024.1 hypothetical protein VDGD_20723 [Verticillium dahliae]
MTRNPFISGAALALSLAAVSIAQENWNQNLVLADCGIGTNPENATWSTSRQINWYHDAIWPTSEEINPIAPDQAVAMPYGDGKYPWNFEGASAILPNGDLWSVWINDGTPEPERAGRASSPKNGGTELWCYTYRNRPISTAVSNSSSICVTAFICNHLGTGPTPWTTAPGAPVQNPPPAPPGASGSPVPPSPPGIPGPPPSPAPPGQSEPAPPSPPPPPSTPPAAELPPSPTSPSAPENARSLKVSVDLSPKPAVWLGTVDAFLSSIKVAATNICQPLPIANGQTSNITVNCQAVNESAIQYLPILFQVVRNLGAQSDAGHWFRSSPGLRVNDTSDDTFQLPQDFRLIATDEATSQVQAFISWEVESTARSSVLNCSRCDPSKFDTAYGQAILAPFSGLAPYYSRLLVESKCFPEVVC